MKTVQVESVSDPYSYMVGIYLVKEFSDAEITEHTIKHNSISMKTSFESIKDKFEFKGGDDLQVHIPKDKFLEIKAVCPITFTLIKTPVKGENCTHIDCFSLENYLQINRKNPTFMCPVCSKKALNPKYDRLMAHILKNIHQDTHSILINYQLEATDEFENFKLDLNLIKDMTDEEE